MTNAFPLPMLAHSRRGKIGIVTGSGPEAGMDLWQKLLRASKALQAGCYRGDLDAPHVEVVSCPGLGLSMELASTDIVVWPVLEATIRRMAEQVDYMAIACNTLNYYSPQIAALPLRAKLISTTGVIRDHIRVNGLNAVALLASRPVMRLDPWSVYANLAEEVHIELPADQEAIHRLIYDVKRLGGSDPALRSRFGKIINNLVAGTVLLACTELPLLAAAHPGKQLVDVTELLARRLAELSLFGEG